MPKSVLASLTSKAAIGIVAAGLAAGSAGVMLSSSTHLISDSEHGKPTTTTTAHVTTTTTTAKPHDATVNANTTTADKP
ncbi:MAG: hypothetical protein QOI47_1916, partial [Actinomycetota bacterium]|nr:hypothetical protein [Actinomycetota bacterium]